ncbi:MAG: hypothetical protein GWM98_01400 [Nitrospinaceae bacterium]|nr:hypothetical protein [Nitrospinaceae bacterium]NIR53401.1 hypothetical protein [Nitrospinaceae bacterium]NIS83805.1 hypothetical protein [Nitrospinaceae bacterium]NIT80601.1 hypothetical protein [Nitrospinaceae bacterium]NIU42925.1 hypothetical protein [Nitrospinaceae bacterium]
MKYLAQSKTLKNLKTLLIKNNKLGDAGVLPLAQSTVFQKLTELDLQWNGITTQGAIYLGASKTLGNLLFLRMWGNEIGGKGVDAIKKNLKKVKNPIYPSAASD